MRMIKFRGKKQGSSIWVYGDLKHDKGISSTGLYDRITVAGYPIEDNTVGQFTGILDKNGKEIYEGDIVKSNLTIGIPNTGCNHKIGDLFVIVCLPSGYTLMAMRDYRYEGRREIPSLAWNLNNYFLWNYHNDFEVIGNIDDNPELLKGGPND